MYALGGVVRYSVCGTEISVNARKVEASLILLYLLYNYGTRVHITKRQSGAAQATSPLFLLKHKQNWPAFKTFIAV